MGVFLAVVSGESIFGNTGFIIETDLMVFNGNFELLFFGESNWEIVGEFS